MRLGYTQAEIAKELGYSGNSVISKRCSDIKKRYLEWAK
jgi:DNA-binding CsgD family transcriptional regulator